jgi:lysophospholipase L1-like esterase
MMQLLRPLPQLRRRLLSAGAAAVLLVGGVTVGSTSSAAAAPNAAGWVGSWATAVSTTGGAGATGFENVTLRQVVHLSVGGNQVRVRLTNVFGTMPLVVNATTVAARGAEGGGSVAGTPVPVTFSGSGAVSIAPGTERVSDPIGLTVADDSDLVISTYLPVATGPATGRGGAWQTNYVAQGDATRSAGAEYSILGTSWYFLDGVDVKTVSAGAVVLFGDSITEGCCSPSSVDTNTRYGDFLADRLLQGPDRREMGVLNAGISGNRVLTDAGNAGVSALARFERDVLGQTGVRSVILLEGINDIGGSRGAVTPEEIIAVYRQMIVRSHDAGLKIFGGTLTPFEGAGYYTEAGEQDRQAVNQWIRTSGEFDGVVDFDRAIRDPQRRSRMLPVYDPGDHLHPNAAGYAAMANAVRIALLR